MGERPRLMNFVTEAQLEENKKIRGERVEDGTCSVDKPLYEVLKEAKEKKEAELKEKYRNLPPKALDEEETEFLDIVNKHRREQERLAAEEEQRALNEFQTAILSRTVKVEEPKAGPGRQRSASLSASAAEAARDSQDQAVGAKRKTHETRQQGSRKGLGGLVVQPRVKVVVQPKKLKKGASPDDSAASQEQETETRGRTASATRGGGVVSDGGPGSMCGTHAGCNQVGVTDGVRGGGAGACSPLRCPGEHDSGGDPSPRGGQLAAPSCGVAARALGQVSEPGSLPSGQAPSEAEAPGLSGLLAYGSDEESDE